jgi:hypothetical protein
MNDALDRKSTFDHTPQMTTFNHIRAAFEIPAAEKPDVLSAAGGYLILRPTEDGWSLLTADGDLVFRGLGTAARRRCLEIAYERGAATVRSH